MRNLARVLTALVLAVPAAAEARPWEVIVGARLRVRPPFEGSDRMVSHVHPTFRIRRSNHERQFTPAEGALVSLGLLDTTKVVIGPILRKRGGRNDPIHYPGLAPFGRSLEPGVFMDYWPKPWLRARVEARRGFGGHEGLIGDAGLDVSHDRGRWAIAGGPRIGFGGAPYMDQYFGVTRQEALASGLAAYRPGAGMRFVGATVGGAYRVDKRLRLNLDVSYSHLAAGPGSSPIVRAYGSTDQVAVGMGFRYVLGKFGH